MSQYMKIRCLRRKHKWKLKGYSEYCTHIKLRHQGWTCSQIYWRPTQKPTPFSVSIALQGLHHGQAHGEFHHPAIIHQIHQGRLCVGVCENLYWKAKLQHPDVDEELDRILHGLGDLASYGSNYYHRHRRRVAEVQDRSWSLEGYFGTTTRKRQRRCLSVAYRRRK